jgi:hypothetical protein
MQANKKLASQPRGNPMSNQARHDVISYLKASHQSIIDPLIVALGLEGSRQSFLQNASYRDFYAVLIERELWEGYKTTIKTSNNPGHTYMQLLDQECNVGIEMMKNRGI